jgi:hypothetical protein
MGAFWVWVVGDHHLIFLSFYTKIVFYPNPKLQNLFFVMQLLFKFNSPSLKPKLKFKIGKNLI